MQETKFLMLIEEDYKRILAWLRDGQLLSAMDGNLIQQLKQELGKAEIVSSDKAPEDLVRLNSRVTVQEDGKTQTVSFTIVPPGKASLTEKKISILAPIATAVIGYKEGDRVQWEVPSGLKYFTIVEVKNAKNP